MSRLITISSLSWQGVDCWFVVKPSLPVCLPGLPVRCITWVRNIKEITDGETSGKKISMRAAGNSQEMWVDGTITHFENNRFKGET